MCKAFGVGRKREPGETKAPQTRCGEERSQPDVVTTYGDYGDVDWSDMIPVRRDGDLGVDQPPAAVVTQSDTDLLSGPFPAVVSPDGKSPHVPADITQSETEMELQSSFFVGDVPSEANDQQSHINMCDENDMKLALQSQQIKIAPGLENEPGEENVTLQHPSVDKSRSSRHAIAEEGSAGSRGDSGTDNGDSQRGVNTTLFAEQLPLGQKGNGVTGLNMAATFDKEMAESKRRGGRKKCYGRKKILPPSQLSSLQSLGEIESNEFDMHDEMPNICQTKQGYHE